MDINRKISIVVSSCDKYSTAWKPYFELIKKFWPGHPKNIFLITESKQYSDPDLNIMTMTYPADYTWSKRLYSTLEMIDSEYVIFSLEDFFLLGEVKQDVIDRCIKWMDENHNIAECRLSAWCAHELGDYWEPDSTFRIAGPNVPFRLDTQIAIWRRTDLMSFIDLKETPWQFEGWGTERIKSSDKIFLWHYQDDMYDISKMIFPYQIDQHYGYGIAWGHWLWNNKSWFKKCGIKGVQYWRLGVISERCARHRFKYLYDPNMKNRRSIAKTYYNLCRQAKYAIHNVLAMGITKGVTKSVKTLIKHI